MTAIVLGIIVLALLAFIAWREGEIRAEREALLQRIQAPEREIARFARVQARSEDEKPVRPKILVSDDEAQLRAIRQREGIADDSEDEDDDA